MPLDRQAKRILDMLAVRGSPAHIRTVEFDPLRDAGHAYAQAEVATRKALA
jgi:hypothetical protein